MAEHAFGPLWKIKDADARNMAAAFYEALLPSDVGPAPIAGQAGSRAGRREVDPDGAEQFA